MCFGVKAAVQVTDEVREPEREPEHVASCESDGAETNGPRRNATGHS